MGWLGISLGITLFVLLCIHWKNQKYNHRKRPLANWINIDEYIVGAMISFGLALFIIALFGGIYSITKDGHDTTADGCEELVNSWNIASAVRDKEYQTSFILGTGGSSTVDMYYVYQQEPEGLLLANYNAHRTYVVEQDGRPKYERIDYICPKPVYDFLWWSTGNTHHNVNQKGTLYVPKATILREFKM